MRAVLLLKKLSLSVPNVVGVNSHEIRHSPHYYLTEPMDPEKKNELYFPY